VTVTSLSQKIGRMRWNDLHLVDRYRPFVAYAQSKLANITFAIALQKRLSAAGTTTSSLVAHPGFADTNILDNHKRQPSDFERRIAERVVQTPAEASRPSLRAATDPTAYGGEFYGPSRRFEVQGPPVPVRPSRRALDEAEQQRLWCVSVEHTGVDYVEIGVEYLGREPRFVKLVTDSDVPVAEAPNGASRCFAALYLPPSAEYPTMPIKTLLLPANDFRTDSDVTLLSSSATYRMRLSQPIQQQYEYVWTSFALVDELTPLPASSAA
jgi:hypothetical protein